MSTLRYCFIIVVLVSLQSLAKPIDPDSIQYTLSKGYYLDAIIQSERYVNDHSVKIDSLLLANGFYLLGEAYRYADSYDKSMEAFLASSVIYEILGRDTEFLRVQNQLAKVHIRRQDYNAVLGILKALRASLDVSSDSLSLGTYYDSYGKYWNAQAEFDSAIFYHQRAISIFEELGADHARGRAMHNLANSSRELGRFDVAQKLCEEVIEIPAIQDNPKSLVFTLLLLANIHNDSGNSRLAVELNTKALQIATDYSLLDRKRVALLYLSQAYDVLGDYRNAFRFHQRYTDLQDSLFNIRRAQQVADLQMKYETEKKERTIQQQEAEIEREEAQNTILIIAVIFAAIIILLIAYVLRNKTRLTNQLEMQKNEIEKQNEERELLLKEIHHRVKNNLQVISSILNIQSRNLEDGMAKDVVREGQSRIKSMSLIHQKLYSNDSFSSIEVKEYLKDLTNYLLKTYKTRTEVKLELSVEERKLDIDTSVPLGLIVNELVSNALKYAFRDMEEGVLRIGLKTDDEVMVLTVSDNGRGLPEDFSESRSMGMRLIRTLVSQLDGELQVKSEDGALFEIRFALAQPSAIIA